MRVVEVSSTTRKFLITPQILSKSWGIGFKIVADSIRVTMKMGYQLHHGKIFRPYRTEQRQMQYQRLDCILYTDTLFSSRKLQQGSTCGQPFLIDFNFSHYRGLAPKKLAYIALAELFERFRVPRQPHRDNAKELMSLPH